MEDDTHLRPLVRPSLHDHVALDEIDLYSEVLIAVAVADRPLSAAEIDRVLGLSPRPAGDDPPDGAQGEAPDGAEPVPSPASPAPHTRPVKGGGTPEDAPPTRHTPGSHLSPRPGDAPPRPGRPSHRGRVPEQSRPPEAPLTGPRFLPRQRPYAGPSQLPRPTPFTMRALPRLPLTPWSY